MIIKKAEINWMKGYGNLPELKVTIDKMPKLGEVLFKRHRENRSTTYWTSENDFVTFFTHVPSNESGFGGATFTGTLEDGTPFKVKGPWSDNAMNVNALFPPSHNVVYYQEEADFPEMGFAAHIKMFRAIELIRECGADYEIIKQYGGRRNEMAVTDDGLIAELIQKIYRNEPIGNYDIAIKLKGMSLEQSQEEKNK